jgi:VCBS repeat-containing protein
VLSFNPANFNGNMAFDTSLSVHITGSATFPDVGSLNNQATVSATVDDNPSDNTAVASIVVQDNPPVASNDGPYGTPFNTPITISAPGVLGNDTDPNGDALTAVLVSGPAHGTLTLSADGSFTYTPAPGYTGSDSFTYKANDGTLDSNVATVSLTVSNSPPVASNDSYSGPSDATLTVIAPGVLANDSDVDGDSLSAVLVSGPAHGTLTLNADGSFSYRPAPGYFGSDSFTYKANDGTFDSNVATVSLTIINAP